jgi:hypothetical protein
MKTLFIQPNHIWFIILGCMCIFCLCFIHYTWADCVVCILTPCTWTFQEYWVHRFFMHNGDIQSMQYAHFKHHKEMHNMKRIFIPIVITMGFALLNFGMFVLALGYSEAFVNFICNSICYMLFEFVHWNCHVDNYYSVFKSLRSFHLKHHAISTKSSMQVNYGFTSATWDLVFHTADYATKIHTLKWILLIPYPIVPFILVDILPCDFKFECIYKS